MTAWPPHLGIQRMSITPWWPRPSPGGHPTRPTRRPPVAPVRRPTIPATPGVLPTPPRPPVKVARACSPATDPALLLSSPGPLLLPLAQHRTEDIPSTTPHRRCSIQNITRKTHHPQHRTEDMPSTTPHGRRTIHNTALKMYHPQNHTADAPMQHHPQHRTEDVPSTTPHRRCIIHSTAQKMRPTLLECYVALWEWRGSAKNLL